MTCPCDVRVFPPPLVIPAGLSDLPRQIATFPEFRNAMLALIPTKPALSGWRARGDDDFGLMWLEMWAYVCDVVSFYDKVLADESYVRTAKLRPSVRKLVSLLGYLPRPAVAASVRLALIADGKQTVSIPVGTAFRSGAFGSEAPQVFEVDAETTIHPAANSFDVVPPRGAALSGTLTHLLVEPATSAIQDGDRLLLDFGGSDVFLRKVTISRTIGSDGTSWVRVNLAASVTLTSSRPLASVKLYKPTRTADLRTPVDSTEQAPLDGWGSDMSHVEVTLDASYTELKNGERVFLSKGDDYRWFPIVWRTEVERTVVKSSSFTSGGTTVTVPAIKARFTRFHIHEDLNDQGTENWTESTAEDLTVHFGMVEVGRVGVDAASVLKPTDTPILLSGVKAGPGGPPPTERFFLEDDEERGVEFEAGLDWTSGALTPTSGTTWSPDLALPVKAYGNVVSAVRGETVEGEVLGSGNASLINQSFELKKKPLTYVASPTAENESGVASTLRIWVDGVEWSEVPSFFGRAPDAQVFIIRQKDDDASVVTFGDGVSGARLPSGASNVVASYRFGAGAASPPAGSIEQLARPVSGLRRVLNPVAAAGGADAEDEESMRALAPRSALLLGRAVSIQDLEAAAAAVPGVIAAAAEWRWEGKRQRPVVKVWYIGGSGLEPTVSARLRAITDPSTPIDVDTAVALSPTLAIDVETDPRYLADDVAVAVKASLVDPDAGLLANERIGIGKPVFRSRIFEAVLAIPGAIGVRSILWNGSAFASYGKTPGAGKYFDFEAGNLSVTGSPTTHG